MNEWNKWMKISEWIINSLSKFKSQFDCTLCDCTKMNNEEDGVMWGSQMQTRMAKS